VEIVDYIPIPLTSALPLALAARRVSLLLHFSHEHGIAVLRESEASRDNHGRFSRSCTLVRRSRSREPSNGLSREVPGDGRQHPVGNRSLMLFTQWPHRGTSRELGPSVGNGQPQSTEGFGNLGFVLLWLNARVEDPVRISGQV
jgi:hypothetical protein